MKRAKIPVRIVFRWRLGPNPILYSWHERLWGGDLLRMQMKELVAPYLPEHFELSVSAFYPRFFGFERWLRAQPRAIFILLWTVGYDLTPAQIGRLREKSIALGLDHKDGDLSKVDLSLFDFHISTSESGRRALTQLLAEQSDKVPRHAFADVLYQSYDLRLKALTLREMDRLSMVYLGLRKNTTIPAALARDIDCLEAFKASEMGAAIRHLPGYNFHYAVRPNPGSLALRCYKPFTKGVTAAACKSNILVNSDVDDAVEFLSPDYPYLIPDSAPSSVVEAYRRAKEDFGGPEWHRGLEIMRSVKERVSGRALAGQLVRIVERAAG